MVIESTDDLPGMLDAVAHSMCLFSAQMCTSVQNIHIPSTGLNTDQGQISADQFAELLVAAIDKKVATGDSAAAINATVQSATTVAQLNALQGQDLPGCEILREAKPYLHPEFPDARTITPLLIQVNDPANPIVQKEHFGPISFLIRHENAHAALSKAASDAKQFGAIASHVYSTSHDFIDQAEIELVDAGASFTVNLTGGMPLNFAAAYSDLHVTGLNPAGNACLADLSFVANRFRRVQARWPQGSR